MVSGGYRGGGPASSIDISCTAYMVISQENSNLDCYLRSFIDDLNLQAKYSAIGNIFLRAELFHLHKLDKQLSFRGAMPGKYDD